jgi:hypothetical protein
LKLENLNKNWLIIILVAAVFGTLGFLVGRTTGQRGPLPIMRFQRHMGHDFGFEKGDDDADVEVTVKMDTVIKDGKQIIIKEIKKIKK